VALFLTAKKKYTPQPRENYTLQPLAAVDGLLNTISGRKAMLKKKSFEKKLQLLDRIDDLLKTSSILKLLRFLRLYTRISILLY
jgi:hypothetical protein